MASEQIAVDGWQNVEHQGCAALRRAWRFADWAGALAFVNAVGRLAEAQDHHPHVELQWGAVTLTVWSHDVGGLTPRDRRLCESINRLDSV